MVENFEQITKELTKDEKMLIPILTEGLKKRSKDNPVKAPEIIKGINKYYGRKVISEPRLRKLCNLLRSTGMLPIIATSKGYYVSYDTEVIKSQIRSLKDRANAILASAEGLEKWTT